MAAIEIIDFYRAEIRHRKDFNMKKIAVWHKKGGVGKTTTSFILATNLAKRGYKVLCLDFDDQCNLTSFFEKDLKKTKRNKASIGQILLSDKMSSLKNAYYKSRFDNLYFVQGSNYLENAVNHSFKKMIDEVNNDFDFLIMDCPPNTNEPTVGALEAADMILTPILLDNFSRDNLNLSQKFLMDRNLEEKWEVFVNRARGLKSQMSVYHDLCANHDYPLLKNAIGESAVVPSALCTYKPLYMHRSKAPVTNDFDALTEEVLDYFKQKVDYFKQNSYAGEGE